ncbi:ABC transporter ATP-binding protein [Oceanibaculum pacificum]|uniref:ABC transporter ATP-binding protein n=1 Tax=Oceanibaculum pacificum TaxID=580166 RepID=A0A154WGT4_9PROT|nr:ABC transporter ATP-binding protein [Oceanibaculum pacificum]KZD12738.1 ABC transporter ATP-binding protein [Oceanibaculum pacificum]
MASGEFVLETEGLSKEFKGFFAVRDVSLRVRKGDIHALIGPNGAGKTTVFNLLTKFLTPTAGRILYKGEEITKTGPADIARKGMVRSFQISAVFPHLSLLENVRIALQRELGTSFHFWKSDDSLSALNDRAMALLEAVGLTEFRNHTAGDLPYGRKRALEIAMALACEPRLLLLDEPTAGMTHEDIVRITDLIGRVSENRTVLMVEHNLSVVSNLSNVITVLQRGEILAEGPYEEVSKMPEVISAYLGTGHG